MEDFAELVSKILFKYDPAYTMCVENELYDEYDMISNTVDRLVWDEGYAVDFSVRNALNESFEPEDLNEDEVRAAISEIEIIVNG